MEATAHETIIDLASRLKDRMRQVLWLADGRVAFTLDDGTHECHRLVATADEIAPWRSRFGGICLN